MKKKGLYCMYSMKKERRVNPIILVNELFWILSNFKTNCISLQHCSDLLEGKGFLNSVGVNPFREMPFKKSLLSFLLKSLLYIVTV